MHHGMISNLVKAKIYICNGNRTEWSPIRSVIIQVITKSKQRTPGVRFIYTRMITDRIGGQQVLLPINHENYNF